MYTKRKQETGVTLNSLTTTVVKQSTLNANRNETKFEQLVSTGRKVPETLPKLLPYTPPDVLMFDLFSAIQRKAWIQARELCYELILCDPLRTNYRDLYERIDRIIQINNRHRRPRQIVSRTITASSINSDRKITTRR